MGDNQNSTESARSSFVGAADPAQWKGYAPRPQGFDATLTRFYESPVDDKTLIQVWTYTDRLSYRPGDEVVIHGSSTVETVELSIFRDGVQTEAPVSLTARVPFALPPADFIERGCNWPPIARWHIPPSAKSGFYIILARVTDPSGAIREQEHGFTILADKPGHNAKILLINTTSTWTAYNDWGGACTYVADNHPRGFPIAPLVTIHRPYARGFISLPENAPRKIHQFNLDPTDIARYPQLEFAYSRGYSRFYGNAGWASYERNFALWAEAAGYELEFATQHDLHFTPELLAKYPCVVIAGHDEYWSWQMREAVDQYVQAGGHLARFAGNFTFQVRLEDQGNTQVCYGRLAATHDPLMGTGQQRQVTTAWEDPLVSWPGAQTLGLNGMWGVYANFGTIAASSAGGFTVFRPDHWALQGTGLGYADNLGSATRVVGMECDGLDYIVRDGLPYPTLADGAREGTDIIAMSLTFNREVPRSVKGEATYLPDETAYIAHCRYGSATPENIERAARGSAMIVAFDRGEGSVFNVGTMDWVAGLKAMDPQVQTVTRNVLDRFCQ